MFVVLSCAVHDHMYDQSLYPFKNNHMSFYPFRVQTRDLTSCNAGASFVPSPVTATTWPFFLSAFTRRSLSFGEDLPITCNAFFFFRNQANRNNANNKSKYIGQDTYGLKYTDERNICHIT
jgi:hypothetical protein